MDPTTQCCCACSTGCDSCNPTCEPHCSTAPLYRKLKAEMPFKKELVCTVKNCNIFGQHDTNPKPEYPCREKRNKCKDPNKNSLGSPVGLSASNVNFSITGKTSDIIKARFATYLKAFARLHLNSELTWDAVLIDDIMKEGLLLYTMSENEKNVLESPPEIYTPIESLILRNFELSGFTFHIELMPKLKANSTATSEMGAKGDGNNMELTLADLKPALKDFFRQKKYCLLAVGKFYLLIWHSKEAYFVFDACGRRLNDFKTDKDQGVAMLICLATLENVRHLIVGLSGLQNSEPLLIREIKVVKVVTPDGVVMQRDYLKRTHQYEIINEDYAYLKPTYHLTLNKTDLLRNRSGLPVAIAAMVASKIDHPATWDVKMADRIICFGVNFCQSCWIKCTTNEIIDVKEFPTFFKMGQFHITTELVESKYEGIWRCVPGFRHSELGQCIKKAFETGNYKLVLQINYQMYAVWKKNDFIYLFDSYRHRILGKPNESEVYDEMEKSATVRMFRSFEVFMNVFNHILLDSNRTSSFSIHVLKVKNIQTSYKHDGIIKLAEAAKLDDRGEVISINEHICFEESKEVCDKVLGEVSDYEDDDLRSDVFEMELKTSSSEAEVMEEEEAGLGALEELEGLESSSSGEEGEGHKKKGQASKGSSKDKTGKSKAGSKGKDSGGSKNKGKKGKGSNEKEGGKMGAQDNGDDAMKINKSKTTEGDNEQDKDTDKSKAKLMKGKDGEESPDRAKDRDKTEDENRNKFKDEGGAMKDKIGQNLNENDGNKDKSKDSEKGVAKRSPEDKLLENDNLKDSDKNKNMNDKNDDDDIASKYKTDEGKNEGVEGVLDKDKEKPLSDKENDKTQENSLKDKSKNIKKDGKTSKDGGTTRAKSKERRGKGASKKIKDGTEADDENEDYFKTSQRYCFPNPNRYPGYLKYPEDMAVVGSQNGSYASLCQLFQAAFKIADRVLAMTPWGNFVVFRCLSQYCAEKKYYFLFDGCTRNFNRFRHLDLKIGTAGLIHFEHIHNVIGYIRRLRKSRQREITEQTEPTYTADDICQQYCNRNIDIRL